VEKNLIVATSAFFSKTTQSKQPNNKQIFAQSGHPAYLQSTFKLIGFDSIFENF
jgi:hypothetical protein